MATVPSLKIPVHIDPTRIPWDHVARSRWTLASPHIGTDIPPRPVVAHGAPVLDPHGVTLDVEFHDSVADRVTTIERWYPWHRVVACEITERADRTTERTVEDSEVAA